MVTQGNVNKAFTSALGELPDQVEPISLDVKQRFPEYVAGTLYRTGPGSYSTPINKSTERLSVRHWFDGFSQNHRFQIKDDGSVWYNSRHSTDGLKDKIAKLGHYPAETFAEVDPCQRMFFKFMSDFTSLVRPKEKMGPSDLNIGVTISPRWPASRGSEESLVARTDANRLMKVDHVTLEPLEIFDWSRMSKELSGPLCAAHSSFDPYTKEEFNYNLKFGARPEYVLFKVGGSVTSKEPEVTILEKLHGVPPAYLHSVFLTPNYFVLCVWQSYYRARGAPLLLLSNLLSGIESHWDASKDTIFYVVARDGSGLKATYRAPAFFSFHTINGHEEDGDIILEVCQSDSNAFLFQLWVENMRNAGQVDFDGLPEEETMRVARWRLPSVASVKDPKKHVDAILVRWGSPKWNLELPHINPKFVMRNPRYVYGIHTQDAAIAPFHALIRYDIEQDGGLVWSLDGGVAGEPIFVPNPDADPNSVDYELDGTLLSVVLDSENNRSALFAIDPKSMTEVARACLPDGAYVGLGFHGAFRAS